jgi:hypothetical protein
MKKGNVLVFKDREEVIVKCSKNRVSGMIVTDSREYSVDFIMRWLMVRIRVCNSKKRVTPFFSALTLDEIIKYIIMTKKDLIPSLLLITLVGTMIYAMVACTTMKPVVHHCNHYSREYSFDVVDDSVFVYTEDDLLVGGIKLEGQLDSLIIADNE